MSIADVTRELLVRYLDSWVPAALHGTRRATFVQAWSGPADTELAEAALRVFGEFGDRMRGRRLTVLVVAPDAGTVSPRLDAVQVELGTPADLAVHAVVGEPAGQLPAALKAAGAAGAPLLAYLDAGDPAAATADLVTAAGPRSPAAERTGAATGQRPPATQVELLVAAGAGGWAAVRAALHDAGCALTAGVELVDGDASRLLAFGTGAAKHLEAFKDCLWAVDEYAGVRYRDPGDPEGHLMDISLRPHPGPLRRELLAHLAAAGPCSVTQLRHFTLTETVYRASDTVRVLTALLGAGTVTRTPTHGRLGGDVLIAAS